MLAIEILQAKVRACRRCLDDGYPISPPPLAWGEAPAPFLLIGQAPGISDLRGGRMYLGPAGRKLLDWLREAGFTDDDFGRQVYLTALTKCFPGRLPNKSTDRAPSAKERANCREWLAAEMELVAPSVVILFGKMAIASFLSSDSLDELVGREFERDGIQYIPLPHSSGASTWLNDPDRRARLEQAIAVLRKRRQAVLSTENPNWRTQQ